MTTNTNLTGYDAIDAAEAWGLTLSKRTDPTEGAREGLSVEEARDVAAEDPSLIYLEPTTVEFDATDGAYGDEGERFAGWLRSRGWSLRSGACPSAPNCLWEAYCNS